MKKPGEHVDEGEAIMVLEAMKMEIEVTAPMQGVVSSIEVAVGDKISDGQLLATLE